MIIGLSNIRRQAGELHGPQELAAPQGAQSDGTNRVTRAFSFEDSLKQHRDEFANMDMVARPRRYGDIWIGETEASGLPERLRVSG